MQSTSHMSNQLQRRQKTTQTSRQTSRQILQSSIYCTVSGHNTGYSSKCSQ